MTSENRKIARLFEPARESARGLWKARKGADRLAIYELAIKLGWIRRGEVWGDPKKFGSMTATTDTPLLRWLVANGKGAAIYGPHPDADPLKVSQLVMDFGLEAFGPDMWIDPRDWVN